MAQDSSELTISTELGLCANWNGQRGGVSHRGPLLVRRHCSGILLSVSPDPRLH